MSQAENKIKNSESLNLASLQSEKKRSKDERKAPFAQISAPEGSTKERRRVGRGRSTGVGKTSGRGHKGQKARSGYSHTAGFEGGQMPLHRRVPKRGFSNHTRVTFQEVNLFRLEKAGVSGEATPAVLFEKGLIRDPMDRIKVLGTGEIKSKIQISADAFSASAKQKIEAAGGSCTVRDRKADKKAAQAAKKAKVEAGKADSK
ncbi:MAG: 50S ribosomal protein L15 [bacterium]|nr:50S ribosomal protein L15 [bacterium]